VALLTRPLSVVVEVTEDRCFCFQILYEVQASMCPVLSSDLLSIRGTGDSFDFLLIFVGDTAGMVSAWLVKSSILTSRKKLIQLDHFNAHCMGTNCISAVAIVVPSDMQSCLHSSEVGTPSGSFWYVTVVSGGDDQALTCSRVVLSLSVSLDDEVSEYVKYYGSIDLLIMDAVTIC